MQVQAEPAVNEMKGLAGTGGGDSPGQEAGVGSCMDHNDEDHVSGARENPLCSHQLMIF